MVVGRVKCMICGHKCTSYDALEHKNRTGHNLWELLIRRKSKGVDMRSRDLTKDSQR